MSTTLSKGKKPLTQRWLGLLPALASAQPLFLVRRHGPLLCGVCLDATLRPDGYYPRAFLHNLAQPFPVVSLTGAAPARDERNAMIEVKVDDEAKAAVAAQALRSAHAWLAQPVLTLADVVAHCADYVEGRFGGVVPFQTGPVELVIHACAWVGRPDLATAVRDGALAEMARWPERAFNIVKSADAWSQRMAPLCQPGADASLKATADAEAVRLKLAALPVLPFDLGDAPATHRRLC